MMDSENHESSGEMGERHNAALPLQESEQDRAAYLGVIEAQGTEIARLYEQLQQAMAETQAVQQRLVKSEQDRMTQRAILQQYGETIYQYAELMHQRDEALTRLQTDKEQIWQTLVTVSHTRAYKLLRGLGRWETVAQTLASWPSLPIEHTVPFPARALTRIAVDLTPLPPEGENGAAKVMTLALLRYLSQAAPELDFVLLTAEKNHEELAVLEAANVRRFCVTQRQSPIPALRTVGGLPWNMKLDLLFCPFTAPFFFDPAIPLVAVVHNLQYLDYPQLFSLEVRDRRDTHFRRAAQQAERLICVSDYVRQTVLDNTDVQPEHVTTIHTALVRQATPLVPEQLIAVLERLGLRAGRFLLYPANFWPHKNHCMLLTALKMYRTRHTGSDLELVCTGTPNADMEYLRDAVDRMALAGVVHFPGYVSDEVYTALLQACRALILPSLYEGFGMPVLEAMAFGKPVLCSHGTSLPEVAGDAALYFDPRKPLEMANAIERIENDAELAMHLVRLGYERLQTFGNAPEMAKRYLQVFRDVARDFHYPLYSFYGIYADGWLGHQAAIAYGASAEQRHLELVLTLPREAPYPWVSAQVRHNGHALTAPCLLTYGKQELIRLELSHYAGYVELLLVPAFQPKAHTRGEDTRTLSCLCLAGRVIAASHTEDLLAGRG